MICESRHLSSDDVPLCRSVPDEYLCFDVPRGHGTGFNGVPSRGPPGGGVVVILRSCLKPTVVDMRLALTTFEFLSLSFASRAGTRVTIVEVYRPGSSPITSGFFVELRTLLELLATYEGHVVVAGDLNVHLEDVLNPHTASFNALISTFGFEQHVNSPTHIKGGILDIFLIRSDSKIQDICIYPSVVSDHSFVSCSLTLNVSRPTNFVFKQIRNFKRMDRNAFKTALMEREVFRTDNYCLQYDAHDLFQIYDTTLRSLLDVYAPLRTVKIRSRQAQWFDRDCHNARLRVRRLERRYRYTKNSSDLDKWKAAKKEKHQLFLDKERRYWETLISANAGNSGKLWKTVSSLMGKTKANGSEPALINAKDYMTYVTTKVESVSAAVSGASPPVYRATDCRLECFDPCSAEEIREMILTSPSKSCCLDPAPTFLIKEFIDCLLPFLHGLCNKSILTSGLPMSQKKAFVTPKLKKTGLDATDVKNYRPISNLSFMSKIVEKIIARQMLAYLESNSLLPKLQSGFRRGHSTETTLVKVLSDIYDAIDTGQMAMLALLDVSAAFDCVDHVIMLERLRISYGVNGSALEWFRSYLTSRRQTVYVNGSELAESLLDRGVPQGSILGPLLYVLYTADVINEIEASGLSCHIYADDIQLYGHYPVKSSNELFDLVKGSVDTVGGWLSSNKLRLNIDKTQFLWMSTSYNLKNFDDSINPVCDLGIWLDANLSMTEHIRRMCNKCYYQLRQIRYIKKYLTIESLKTLVSSFICNRIDFCNSILYGTRSFLLDCVQSVLNAAARLIAGVSKFHSISSYIRNELHWLPIYERIEFKIAMIVRDCLVGFAPVYLQELVQPVSTISGRRQLRSSNHGDLFLPKFRSSKYGKRRFPVAAAHVWNQLPVELKNGSTMNRTLFKKRLKHYMFNRNRSK